MPSATFYAEASARAHGDRRRMSALVVGNPSLEPELARRLDNLPGAFREAERVAPLYGRRRLLRGAEAGRRVVTGLLLPFRIPLRGPRGLRRRAARFLLPGARRRQRERLRDPARVGNRRAAAL